MQENILKTLAFHITPVCSHKCGFCYYAGNEKPEKTEHPPLKDLMRVIDALKKSSVENIIFVGGDPGGHPEIVNLAKYAKEAGFHNTILSNTLLFPKYTTAQASQYFDAFEVTIHGKTAKEHDEFCEFKGAYDVVTTKLRQLSEQGKAVGIVINATPKTADGIFDIVKSLREDKGINLSYIGIQRIVPLGRAEGNDEFTLSQEQVIKTFEGIEKVEKELNIPVEMMDTFPQCSVPKKYQKYINSCSWGIDAASVDYDGNIARCGADAGNVIGNIFDKNVEQIWRESEKLKKFRNLEHVDETCKECDNVDECRGGCLSSSYNHEYGVDILRSKGR